MAGIQIVIEYDPQTERVRVGHPTNRMLCDFMLAEARRILDRQYDKAAENRTIVQPVDVLPAGLNSNGG